MTEHELTAAVERRRQLLDETSGLVRAPMPTPMLQPWEVFDPDLFDLEMIRVFGRSWVWLGDTEDLAEPGDYVTATIGHQSVIVVRTAAGEIKGFTGVDDPYETPADPEIVVDTEEHEPHESAAIILGRLEQLGLVPSRVAS